MMLQYTGLSDLSTSSLVPCLSPPGSLTLEDFTSFPPTVKEELRLAIQTKRLSSGLNAELSDYASSSSDQPSVSGPKRQMTPEENERRKKRRERNKIAAAKCRNKKKEKTDGLQQESEKLESVNAELKAQIEALKQQKQQLVYMLNLHRPTCIVRAQNGQTPEDERKLFLQHMKDSSLQIHSLATAPPLEGGLSLAHVHCGGHPLPVPTSCGGPL